MGEHTPAPTPSRGVYGFALYLICMCSFGLYVIWAAVPDNILHSVGITYYPQKYWAIALPVYCMMGLAIFAFFIYPGLNLLLTPPLNSMTTVTDPHAVYKDMTSQESFLNRRGGGEESNVHGIPPASDIHISQELPQAPPSSQNPADLKSLPIVLNGIQSVHPLQCLLDQGANNTYSLKLLLRRCGFNCTFPKSTGRLFQQKEDKTFKAVLRHMHPSIDDDALVSAHWNQITYLL